MPAATPQGTKLTERQASYLALSEDGKNHQEIAEHYGVSVGTVKSVLYFVHNRAIGAAGERVLTARQLEILRLYGEGNNTTEIGEQLFLSPWTVSNHLRDARSRLGAMNSIHAVLMAVSLELLILDHNGRLLVPHAHRVAA